MSDAEETRAQQKPPPTAKASETKRQSFICEICFLVCYSKSDLGRHKLTHDGKTDFRCDFCLQVFQRESGMRRHLRHAHPDEEVPIPQHGNAVALLGYKQPVVILGKRVCDPVQVHSVVTNNRDSGGDECQMTLTGNKRKVADMDRTPLKLAKRTENATSTKIFTCRVCFNEFTSIESLSQHLDLHEKSAEAGILSDDTLNSGEKLVLDLTTEEIKETSNVDVIDNSIEPLPEETFAKLDTAWIKEEDDFDSTCDKNRDSAFVKPTKQKNLKDVIGRIGVACNVCEEVFSDISELQHHVKSEHFQKLVYCGICGIEFTRKNNLIRHFKAAHKTEGSFECDKCSEIFTVEHSLLVHQLSHEADQPVNNPTTLPMSSHSQKKPYSRSDAVNKCKDCEQTFMFKKDLKLHRRETHKHTTLITDEPPVIIQDLVMKEEGRAVSVYKCNLCPRSFNLKSDLMRHFLIHSGEKPFVCDMCNNRFNRKSNLVRHKRLMHDVAGSTSARGKRTRVRERREWEDGYSDDEERTIRKFGRKMTSKRNEIWEIEEDQFVEEERRLLSRLMRERDWQKWQEGNVQDVEDYYEIEDDEFFDEGVSSSADGKSEMEVTVIEPGDQITVRILTY